MNRVRRVEVCRRREVQVWLTIGLLWYFESSRAQTLTTWTSGCLSNLQNDAGGGRVECLRSSTRLEGDQPLNLIGGLGD